MPPRSFSIEIARAATIGASSRELQPAERGAGKDVIEGAKRLWLGTFAYGIVPGALLAIGLMVTRGTRRRPG